MSVIWWRRWQSKNAKNTLENPKQNTAHTATNPTVQWYSLKPM